MLHLLLFRHARAVPAQSAVADEDRPLTQGGRDAAASMGRLLAERGLAPDFVRCSPAMRTRQTLDFAALGWMPRPEVETVPQLYKATGDSYLAAIRSGGPGSRLMLVGHNPAIEDTARQLAGDGAPEALAGLFAGFPTSGVAVIEFELAAWSDVQPGRGRLTAFLTAG